MSWQVFNSRTDTLTSIILIAIAVISIIVGIVLWAVGWNYGDRLMAVMGSFLCLGFIGLLISLLTTRSNPKFRKPFYAPPQSQYPPHSQYPPQSPPTP